MAAECILAVDQGTTNTKALLFDREGRAVFRTACGVSLQQPKPGYIEQDPLELWRSTRSVLQGCALHAAANGQIIEGIAISNQRETAVAWNPVKPAGSDASGSPVSPAISWQCRRSAPECERLRSSAALVQDRSGLPLDPLLTATKWKWLFDHHPALREEMQRGDVLLGTVDSWLLFNLTGGRVHATDLTNASRVALLNLECLDWDEDLLRLFGILRESLPALHASSSVFGECSVIQELAGVPVVAVIGDSHGALVGHGLYEPGTVKATYGTGSSLMMLTAELPNAQKSLSRTIAWSLPGKVQYALEGNIAMSGAALHWVGDFLGLPHPAEDAAALAETVTSSAGMVLIPAMVGLGAPHWDPAARGLIANIERTHTGAHLARAALEAIAMQVADVLEAMEATAGSGEPVLLADGGATKNQTLMQTQANFLKRRVRRSAETELSARGAAVLGGLTIGWWRDMGAIASLPADGDWFVPELGEAERGILRRQWCAAVAQTRLHTSESGCTASEWNNA